MPSIFSWRPTKLQVRLKKLSHQLGSANGGGGLVTNAVYQSSDEEDDDVAEAANHHHKVGGEEDAKTLIRKRQPDVDASECGDFKNLSNNDDEMASNFKHQERSLSDEEFFRARTNNSSRVGDNSLKSEEDRMSHTSKQQRAVRFVEEVSTGNQKSQQPPVCNVAPTNFSNQLGSSAISPSTRLSGGIVGGRPNSNNNNSSSSLQYRALMSPVSQMGAADAAALPPRYSPSPALKTAGNPSGRTVSQHANTSKTNTMNIINSYAAAASNGERFDARSPSSTSQRSFLNTTAFDSTSENETTGGEFEELENARPPRPARFASAHNSAQKNKANIILQHLRSDSELSGSPITVAQSEQQRSPYANALQSSGKFSFSTASEPANAGFVFLEFNDEVKRSAFPTNVRSIEQIKSLFLRTFPNLSMEYLNLANVKIYIQESTKSHLFYELEDVKDVKSHSLLKIREQQLHRSFQSPPPIRFFDRSDAVPSKMNGGFVVDYLSEPEIDYGSDKSRYYNGAYNNSRQHLNNNFMQEQQRPASVLPRMELPPRSPLHFQMSEQHRNQRTLLSPTAASTHSLPLPRMGTGYMGNSTNAAGINSSASSLNSSSGGSSAYLYGPYYDPYYSSDSSSRASRSGSSTPIMIGSGPARDMGVTLLDEKTRQRVETMERQLAGLSTLVHSALITREMNPTVRQEMMQLQRQILELQTPSSLAAEKHMEHTASEINSSWLDKARNVDPNTLKAFGGAHKMAILQNLNCEAKRTSEALKQLRNFTQLNAQSCQDTLTEASKMIREELTNYCGESKQHSSPITLKNLGKHPMEESDKLEGLRKVHLSKLDTLKEALRIFEQNVEEIRNSVLNSNRKLRMAEVEALTNKLIQIGEDSAVLKTRFPELQTELEKKIHQNMENIVKEENFIKQENEQVDECLRRCKNLANMMGTMKKLAMVQDPALKSLVHENGAALQNRTVGKYHNKHSAVGSKRNDTVMSGSKLTGVATTIQNNKFNNENSKAKLTDETDTSKANVLDNILDELNFSPTVIKKNLNVNDANFGAPKSPPKPPERKRYHTTEIRLQYEKENGIPPNTSSKTATGSQSQMMRDDEIKSVER